MMWNFLVGALLTPASIVLYDGRPGAPSLDRLWDLAAEAEITCFGTSAAYIASCMKGGVQAGRGARPRRAAQRRRDRLAAVAGGLSLGLRGARLRHVAVLDERRDGRLHGVRRRRAAGARLRGRAAGPLAGLRRAGIRRAGPAARRRGRRARHHAADALDAAVLLERPRRRAAARGVLRDVSRRLAPRRLDRADLARHGDHLRAQRLDDQPRRRAHGHERDLPRRAGARRDRRRARRRRPARGRGELDGAVRRAARRRRAGRRRSCGAIARRVRSDCSPRHVPDDVYAVAEVPRTLSGKILEVPVKRILAGTPARAGRQPRLARQPGGAGLVRRVRPRARGGGSRHEHEPGEEEAAPAGARRGRGHERPAGSAGARDGQRLRCAGAGRPERRGARRARPPVPPGRAAGAERRSARGSGGRADARASGVALRGPRRRAAAGCRLGAVSADRDRHGCRAWRSSSPASRRAAAAAAGCSPSARSCSSS